MLTVIVVRSPEAVEPNLADEAATVRDAFLGGADARRPDMTPEIRQALAAGFEAGFRSGRSYERFGLGGAIRKLADDFAAVDRVRNFRDALRQICNAIAAGALD